MGSILTKLAQPQRMTHIHNISRQNPEGYYVMPCHLVDRYECF